mgnify:CR=1 FL=1
MNIVFLTVLFTEIPMIFHMQIWWRHNYMKRINFDHETFFCVLGIYRNIYQQNLVDKDPAIIKWEHLTQSQFSPTLRNAAKNEKVLFLHTSKKVVKKHSVYEFFSC